MRMMKLWLTQRFELLRRFVESCIVNCSSARPCERQISEVYALKMPQFSILRQQKRPRGF
jgi:hypothetical protein